MRRSSSHQFCSGIGASMPREPPRPRALRPRSDDRPRPRQLATAPSAARASNSADGTTVDSYRRHPASMRITVSTSSPGAVVGSSSGATPEQSASSGSESTSACFSGDELIKFGVDEGGELAGSRTAETGGDTAGTVVASETDSDVVESEPVHAATPMSPATLRATKTRFASDRVLCSVRPARPIDRPFRQARSPRPTARAAHGRTPQHPGPCAAASAAARRGRGGEGFSAYALSPLAGTTPTTTPS